MLFKRTPYQGVKLVVLLLLSVLLIVTDHYQHHSAKLRTALSVAVTPVQYLVDFPLRVVDWMQMSFSGHRTLISENAALRAEQLLLKAQIQKLIALEQENQDLRALLKSTPRVEGKVVVGQLMSVDVDPFTHQVVLNKGSLRRVYEGQPVLDANGVMGQVIRVGPYTSHVLLLSDTRSAIPVEVSRNGLRAILVGRGDFENLELANVSKTTDIREGDVLVTSSLAEKFPPGYPVGEVTSVIKQSGDSFAKIYVRPIAHLNRSRLVLLVWPPARIPEDLLHADALSTDNAL